MTAQETNLLNAFETTLTGTIGASDLTMTVNSVVDSASNTLTAPCYLVVNPDSATNREVILVTSINAGTKTLTCDNINKRFLTGSAATSGLSHSSGATVRVSPVQQHIEDINDRVDTVINEAGTAVNTTLFLDEDDMSSNSATKDHAWNEISGRYVPVEDYYYPSVWRKQSEDNKQASEGVLDDLQQKRMNDTYDEFMRQVRMSYGRMIEAGVAKEQARIMLPLNQYTEVYWTASFQAVMNFIELRDEKTSQWEIQEYAKVIKELCLTSFPKITKLWLENA